MRGGLAGWGVGGVSVPCPRAPGGRAPSGLFSSHLGPAGEPQNYSALPGVLRGTVPCTPLQQPRPHKVGALSWLKISLMTLALSPGSCQRRSPESFRRASRDLGPGREGPSSPLVTCGRGEMVHSAVLPPSPLPPLPSPPLPLVPLVTAGWRLQEVGPKHKVSECCTSHSQAGLGC